MEAYVCWQLPKTECTYKSCKRNKINISIQAQAPESTRKITNTHMYVLDNELNFPDGQSQKLTILTFKTTKAKTHKPTKVCNWIEHLVKNTVKLIWLIRINWSTFSRDVNHMSNGQLKQTSVPQIHYMIKHKIQRKGSLSENSKSTKQSLTIC